MSIFKFRKLDSVGRLRDGDWAHELERDSLIKKALGPQGTVDPIELTALLFVRDTEVRKATLVRVHQVADPGFVETFLLGATEFSDSLHKGACRAVVKILAEGWHARAAAMLFHEDERVREAATELLSVAPISEGLLASREWWLKPDSVGATRIMKALRTALKEGTPLAYEVTQVCQEATGHQQPAVRRQGYLALGSLADAEGLEKLLGAWGRETEELQHAMKEVFEVWARDATLDLTQRLLPLLCSESPQTREAAAMFAGMTDYLPRVVDALVRRCLLLKDWQRAPIFETVSRLGDPLLEPVLALLSDANPEVRVQALNLSGSLSKADARMTRPLLALLEQDDWAARTRAIELLGQLGDPAALSHLAKLLQDRDTALCAIHALARSAGVLAQRRQAEPLKKALAPLLGILEQGYASQAGPDGQSDLRDEVLTALRGVTHADAARALLQSAKQDRAPALRARALTLAEGLYDELEESLPEAAKLRQEIEAQAARSAHLTELDKLLKAGRDAGATDVYVAVGHAPMLRKQGALRPLERREVLSAQQTARMLREILTDAQAQQVAAQGQLDLCHEVEGSGRYRASVFADHRGVHGVFRVIPREIPTLSGAKLPPEFADAAYWRDGLVLVCGGRGSGKTTTMSALIHQINHNRQAHVISIEAPIEHLHASDRSRVTQREVGQHSGSFARALRAALRQDPDAVFLGELPDRETAALALKAASEKTLVVAAVRASGAELGLRRLLDHFPPEERARARGQLALSLRAVLAQALLPRTDHKGMAPAFEVMVASEELRPLLAREDLAGLRRHIQEGGLFGTRPLDQSLQELHKAGAISAEDAYRHAHQKEKFERYLPRQSSSSRMVRG
jgi:twitching motility protein PilT